MLKTSAAAALQGSLAGVEGAPDDLAARLGDVEQEAGDAERHRAIALIRERLADESTDDNDGKFRVSLVATILNEVEQGE
jgi:hypothetical protein